MTRLGVIKFQANDRSDIFLTCDIIEDGISPSDESLMQIGDSQFDSDKAWVTGKVPQIIPVNIEGDNSVIKLLLGMEQYVNPIAVRVYIEFEEAEEFVSEETEREQEEEEYNPEEGEINL